MDAATDTDIDTNSDVGLNMEYIYRYESGDMMRYGDMELARLKDT